MMHVTSRMVVLAGFTTLFVGSMNANGSSTAAEQPQQGDSAKVAQVVERFHNALSAGDSAGALLLLAPDALILESGGMETRSEYRSHHLPGDIGYARAVRSSRGPIKVSISGSVAWTVSTSTTQGQYNGRAINSLGAESMVLSRTRDGWRIRSIHWSSRNRRPAS